MEKEDREVQEAQVWAALGLVIGIIGLGYGAHPPLAFLGPVALTLGLTAERVLSRLTRSTGLAKWAIGLGVLDSLGGLGRLLFTR